MVDIPAPPPGFQIVSGGGATPPASAPAASIPAPPPGFQIVGSNQPPTPVPDGAGIAPQALSGVNEGLASFLSLPNTLVSDAELGLRSIGPSIGNALGGHFAMPTEPLLKLPDAGAAYRGVADSVDAIKPVSADPVDQFSRRVGQEVGANLIPTMGLPGKVASVIATLGGGTGAAIAQQVMPGNQGAELAGEMVGGFMPLSVANQFERMGMKTVAPTVDELRTAKTAAYKAVDNVGAQYSPSATNDLITKMQAAASGANPMRHPAAVSVLDDISKMANTPQSLTQLDELRQVISRDLIKSADGGERHWGYQLRGALDDFIEKAGPGQMLSGDPAAASGAITVARAMNARYRKTEDFASMMTKADHAAGSSGSGGNINNAIRQKARQILDNPARVAGYSPEEKAALETLVMGGGKMDDALRLIGKLAPGGNGLMTALSTGAVFHNPLMAPIPIAAQVAKNIADNGTVSRARVVQAMLARGGQKAVPMIGPKSGNVAQTLLAGEAANQNAPRTSVVDAVLARANGR